MRSFLATVLSVIAAGVLLIAWGLLAPRAAADAYSSQLARSMPASDLVTLGQPAPGAPVGYDPYYAPRNYLMRDTAPAAPARIAASSAAPVRRTAVSVESRRRDWKKTALVIGGSTAAGAGLGAIFGGKKGALIGAALGGGGSTIYEAVKR